ncbi:hypothetical protein N7456_001885 [Penicillium angulare]|uniref:Uncharacterized protein n=1 Tax=Penicillium angulare TaxID=116970 RepID=A0A9W9G754_9EURO|nr:hypothetical protein N7456_001885 [Penicillium angulare]
MSGISPRLRAQMQKVPEFQEPVIYSTDKNAFKTFHRRVAATLSMLRVHNNARIWKHILTKLSDDHVFHFMCVGTPYRVKALLDRPHPPTFEELNDLQSDWQEVHNPGVYLKMLKVDTERHPQFDPHHVYVGSGIRSPGGMAKRKEEHLDPLLRKQLSKLQKEIVETNPVITWGTLFLLEKARGTMVMQNKLKCLVAEAILSTMLCAYAPRLDAKNEHLNSFIFDSDQVNWTGVLSHCPFNESTHIDWPRWYLKAIKDGLIVLNTDSTDTEARAPYVVRQDIRSTQDRPFETEEEAHDREYQRRCYEERMNVWDPEDLKDARARATELQRIRRNARTPYQIERDRKIHRERQRRKAAARTPDENEANKKYYREKFRGIRANETAADKKKASDRSKKEWAEKSPEEKAAISQRQKEYRQTLSEVQRARALEKLKARELRYAEERKLKKASKS